MLTLLIPASSTAVRVRSSLGSLSTCSRKTCQSRTLTVSNSTRNGGVKLTAAEREWLQEDDADTESELASSVRVTHQPRFDWRQTLLRVRRKRAASAVVDDHSRFIKRVAPPCMSIQPRSPFYREIQAYNEHFLPLLDAEQQEDEAVIKERLSNWSLARLQEEGYCLTELAAFWLKATQFGRPVAAFTLGPGIALPTGHRFENGTQVLLSRIDPLREQPLQGSVVSTTGSQIKVSFPELYDLGAYSGSWRLDVGHTNLVYERMRTAIGFLEHDPSESDVTVPDRQLIIQGTYLRDKLLRSFDPATKMSPPSEDVEQEVQTPLPRENSILCDDMRIHSWATRYSRPNPVRVEGDPVITGLNSTQIRAIATMIGQRLSLVQGPPGTGKTKTIVETVKLLKVQFQIVHPVLVCTYTNVAVDNLVEGLAAAGMKPLRIGYGGKVKTSLYEHTLDAKLEKHPLRPQLDKLIKEQTELMEQIESRRKVVRDKHLAGASASATRMEFYVTQMDRQLKILNGKIYALRQVMLQDIVYSADVVCTTCVTSACVALNVIDFPIVFLDEASMSTEPASLIPLMKGSQQVCLIGDHKQLPPIITSRQAQSMGLGISLFERLTEEGQVPSIMLDTQYRMHPAISRFPSSEFYQFSLQDGTVEPDGSVHPRLLPPTSSHLEDHPLTGHRPSVIFLDHTGLETPKDRSRVNWAEAGIVCSIVEDLLLQNENMRGADIGIIAPYVAQISLLSRLFRTDHRYRERFKAVLGPQRAMQLANVEIKTVDGFEGREKEVIIFSTVRNNAAGHIGFLADRRRLNVGLTRAKRGLFVVGSLNTLRNGKVSGQEEQGNVRVGRGAEAWRRYAQFLHDEGLVVQLSGERLRKTLYGNISDTNVLLHATY
ncbi:P-loop containing nucleoside triphosphate hydrolase protein [Neolentinus lepideus HHB14362 ss-1]|uniref:p-loop containing nucleoside triphosphate hydrolase protein n=1 Tax=Neolentinus lepideus HHB14362 ss-1 TaxID=1314782 RepID=A0A165QYG9_9AGAM|nr:P-loop containing nucleoside triphosphate hydrolase protein [Neolentinus lepideus HHB14362 ss-1]